MTEPASCTFNGSRVLTATIVRSVRGAWTARALVDAALAPSRGAPGVFLFTGETGATLSLVGTVERAGVYLETLTVRAIGGIGGTGLGEPVRAKQYQAMPIRAMVADLMAAGGLTLSQASDRDVLERFLPFWHRTAGSVGEALEALAHEAGVIWRALEDGTIRIGAPAWEVSPLDFFEVIHEDPQDGTIEIATDLPTLAPGTTFRGGRVVSVTDTIDAGKARTLARYA